LKKKKFARPWIKNDGEPGGAGAANNTPNTGDILVGSGGVETENCPNFYQPDPFK
jgi:hypothetical protein